METKVSGTDLTPLSLFVPNQMSRRRATQTVQHWNVPLTVLKVGRQHSVATELVVLIAK